jgi:hypothetical protein
MAHESVETPNVGRSVFASLARIRDEFPGIASGGLGWGIEYPEATQNGAFTTTLHVEVTPGLALLSDRCCQEGLQLPAIWCAHTVAASLAGFGSSATEAKFIVIMLPGFVAVASCSRGKRYFKSWTDGMSSRDWKALAALLGEFDSQPAVTIDDVELRRGLIKIVVQGKPEDMCPFWDEVARSGRISSISGLDALAAGAEKITPRHPGNLSSSFVKPRILSHYVWILGIAALGAAAFLFGSDLRGSRQLHAEEASNDARIMGEKLHLAKLKHNQAEMGRLQRELPPGWDNEAAIGYDALARLGTGLPDYLTLTSLSMEREGIFELEAVVSAKDFDPEDARKRLENVGYKADQKKGCVFNAALNSLLVRGTFVCAKK